MGRRVDFYERPELSLGSYEFVATLDYCKVTGFGGNLHILSRGLRTLLWPTPVLFMKCYKHADGHLLKKHLQRERSYRNKTKHHVRNSYGNGWRQFDPN